MADSAQRSYWAVLIGINYYTSYNHLSGCVQDVEDVEQLLQSHLRGMPLQITKITASGPNEPQPPTFDTVMAALEEVKAKARSGDFIYFHFSGHGAREESRKDLNHPSLNSVAELYEVLVLEGTRHLKDYELGNYLQGLAAEGLIPFATLDCCHSGGGDRINDKAIRGIDKLRTADDETDADSLGQDVTGRQIGLTRDANSCKSYWQQARDYTVLAACQPHETARESSRRGKMNGALTHWLIKSIGQLGGLRGLLTYKRLHCSIYANMSSEFSEQHCMLLGKADRVLFGNDTLRGTDAAHIIEINRTRLSIDIGEVHGVRNGEEYAIYKHSSSGLHASDIVCNIVIDRVGGLRSSAKIPRGCKNVELGCMVALLTPVIDTHVRVTVERPDMLQSMQEFSQKQAASGIQTSFVPPEDGDATYHVIFDEGYQISDATRQPIQNCPLVPADGEAAGKIFQIIQQLAKYRMVAALHNKKSKLDGLFKFRVFGDILPGQETEVTEVVDGDIIYIEFENLSDRPLYFTLLDLTPRWAIKSVIPAEGQWSVSVAARSKSDRIDLDMIIPEEVYEDDTSALEKDIFKIIVTTEPSRFEMLEIGSMPTRDAIQCGDLHMESPAGLEELLENLEGWREAKNRKALGDWQTDQIIMTTLKVEEEVS